MEKHIQPKIYIKWTEHGTEHKTPLCYTVSPDGYSDTWVAYEIQYKIHNKLKFERIIVPKYHTICHV